MPWITGASGGLEYDAVLGVDPIASYYSEWQVSNGTFRTLQVLDSVNSTVPDKTGGESAGGKPCLGRAYVLVVSAPGNL